MPEGKNPDQALACFGPSSIFWQRFLSCLKGMDNTAHTHSKFKPCWWGNCHQHIFTYKLQRTFNRWILHHLTFVSCDSNSYQVYEQYQLSLTKKASLLLSKEQILRLIDHIQKLKTLVWDQLVVVWTKYNILVCVGQGLPLVTYLSTMHEIYYKMTQYNKKWNCFI